MRPAVASPRGAPRAAASANDDVDAPVAGLGGFIRRGHGQLAFAPAHRFDPCRGTAALDVQIPHLLGIPLSTATITHLVHMIFGALIVFFLIVEPHGLAKLWSVGKQKLRLWPFPH